MNNKSVRRLLHSVRFLLHFFLLPAILCLPAFGQGTAFTYQGRLTVNGSAAAGVYDLRFTVYDSTNLPGVVVAGPVTNASVDVANGLFTTIIDFGTGVFNGPNRWLEIAARTNSGGAFTALTPRQALTPTPYAIFAGGANAAGLTGTIPAASIGGTYSNPITLNNGANSFSGTFYGQFLGISFIGGSFSGAFIGDGSGLANVNAATFGGVTGNQIWKTIGNTNTTPGVSFLGTPDNQPLEIRVNNRTAYRFLPSSDIPNVIGGSLSNSVGAGVIAATIAGGGLDLFPNVVNGSFSAIGGGTFNTAAGAWSTIAGGRDNNAFADHSTVAGGRFNTVQTNADYGAIGGGFQNQVQTNADYATVGGGLANIINTNSQYATIGGGWGNTIVFNDTASTISGGRDGIIFAPFATIAGGEANTIFVLADHANIGGGEFNRIYSGISIIGGGFFNTILSNADGSTIGGGTENLIETNAQSSTIGGGSRNTIHAPPIPIIAGATIGGGYLNDIRSNINYTTIAGGIQNTNGSGQSFIGGGFKNSIQALSANSTIAGGSQNIIQTNAGGSTIAGGSSNLIQTNSSGSAIGGGSQNVIQGIAPNATIAGGLGNSIFAGASYSVIGGGYNNTNFGNYSTIPGGQNNAAGPWSFAAGVGAKAIHSGTFVWSDISSGADFNSVVLNEFAVRAAGGVRLVTSGAGLTVDGQSVFAGTNGSGLANVNAATVGGVPASALWQTGGNLIIPGQFLGSTNSQPVEFRVNSVRAMRMEPAFQSTTHLIGGSRSNGIAGGIGAGSIFGATIGGGGSDVFPNVVSDDFATIGGGNGNIAGNTNSSFDIVAPTVSGGDHNVATGSYSTIPGGHFNFASGDNSFAAGTLAQATNAGAFVWSDNSGAALNSTNANSVTMRAIGGYRLFSNAGASAGVYLAPGGGSWTVISDRNAKENFHPVNVRDVLEQVVAMPIQTWNYKSQDRSIRHVGPMAQDFRAAFGVGETDNGITTVDADGVALAAIQGLNQRLTDELKRRDAENAELRRELAELRSLVKNMPAARANSQ